MTLTQYINSLNEQIVPQTFNHLKSILKGKIVLISRPPNRSIDIVQLSDLDCYGFDHLRITKQHIKLLGAPKNRYDSFTVKHLFPHLSTEEEHFQESLMTDLTGFDLDFFIACKRLFDNVCEKVLCDGAVNI